MTMIQNVNFVNEAGHELKVKSTIFGEYATSAIITSAPVVFLEVLT